MELKSPKPSRLVVLGANLETETALHALFDAGAAVNGLLTFPSGKNATTSDYRDLHELAAQYGVTVVDTTDVNSLQTLGALRELAPDYLFILGWSQICRAEVLSIPRCGSIGTHPSPLPLGRGRAPLPWAIIDGDVRGAVSFFEATLRADAGPLFHQEFFDIPHGADVTALYELAIRHLARGICHVYRRICNDTLSSVPQDDARATYRAKRVPADGWIDFSKSAEDVDRLVRAVSRPYPGAYTYYAGRKVKFWHSRLKPRLAYKGSPGQILLKRGGELYVQCCDYPLWLSDAESDGASVELSLFCIGERFGYRIEDELYELKRLLCELMGDR